MANEIIHLHWWFDNNWKTNFGDIVSQIVIEKLSGKKVVHAEKRAGGKLLAAGSILTHANAGDYIWGTGAHYAHHRCKPQVYVCAMRGPLTKKVLEQSGYKPKKIYGDPVNILPYLFKTKIAVKYEMGIIPHFVDYESVNNQIKNLSVNVIDVMSGVKNIIKEVAKCQCIFSSSLHGIMVGEVFDKPTCWVKISDKIASPEFKFQDYYFSSGRIVEVVDWRNGINLSEGIDKCKEIMKPAYETEKFLLSCPVLKPEIRGLSDIESETLIED